MVFMKSDGFLKPKLLTNHHIVFVKSDGFHLAFHEKPSHLLNMVLIDFFQSFSTPCICMSVHEGKGRGLQLWTQTEMVGSDYANLI